MVGRKTAPPSINGWMLCTMTSLYGTSRSLQSLNTGDIEAVSGLKQQQRIVSSRRAIMEPIAY